MAIKNLLIETTVARIANHEKFKKIKGKRRAERRKHREWIIKTFGRTRYYLSIWFGEWALWTWRKA